MYVAPSSGLTMMRSVCSADEATATELQQSCSDCSMEGRNLLSFSHACFTIQIMSDTRGVYLKSRGTFFIHQENAYLVLLWVPAVRPSISFRYLAEDRILSHRPRGSVPRTAICLQTTRCRLFCLCVWLAGYKSCFSQPSCQFD